jgi:hypothetical protein
MAGSEQGWGALARSCNWIVYFSTSPKLVWLTSITLSIRLTQPTRDILANDTEAARRVAFLLRLGGVDLADEEGAWRKENDDANP